jgi:hypothetical protein
VSYNRASRGDIMHVLTHITEVLKEKITRGRFTGQETNFQFCIAADKYNWVLCRLVMDKKGKPSNEQGLKFYSSFGNLFSCMVNEAKWEGLKSDMFNLEEVFNRVNTTLAEKTNLPQFVPENKITEENCKEVGKALTQHYRVNYCSAADNPREGVLTERLFK